MAVLQRRLGAVVLLTWLAFASMSAGAQSPGFAPGEESPDQFPVGLGREETFYACTACHNFKLVAAQGMSRSQWEDTLAWMTQRHGMPPLDGTEREHVLSYLESTFPPQPPQARGGWRNPFVPP
jgi:hypothetical protein